MTEADKLLRKVAANANIVFQHMHRNPSLNAVVNRDVASLGDALTKLAPHIAGLDGNGVVLKDDEKTG